MGCGPLPQHWVGLHERHPNLHRASPHRNTDRVDPSDPSGANRRDHGRFVQPDGWERSLRQRVKLTSIAVPHLRPTRPVADLEGRIERVDVHFERAFINSVQYHPTRRGRHDPRSAWVSHPIGPSKMLNDRAHPRVGASRPAVRCGRIEESLARPKARWTVEQFKSRRNPSAREMYALKKAMAPLRAS